MTGLWVIGFQGPWCSLFISFSNKHGIFDSGGFFLRTILEEKMLQSFSYSSPHLGSKQHCREAAEILIHFTVQLLRACVCTSIPWCNSQKLQLGGTSTGQTPPVPSATHPRCDWELVFALFSPCPQQRQQVDLASVWKGQWAHWGSAHVTGRNLCWVTGSAAFGQ